MSDPSDKERLEQLDARIRKLKGTPDAPPETTDHRGQLEAAWRMVIELVSGIVIGFGIGYGLDAVFGTRPILMVLFVLLGFAAGVRVMLRTAQELNKQAGTTGDDEGN